MRSTPFMVTCLLVMSFFSSCLEDMLTRLLVYTNNVIQPNKLDIYIYIFKIILI